MKTRWGWLWVGVLWGVQSVAGPSAPAKKMALLIGIGDYIYLRDFSDTRSKLPPGDLRGPGNDVMAMKDLLRQCFAFQEEDIQVLRDQEATEENVRRALNSLVERVQEGDWVVLYFSGHGSRRLESNYQEKAERDEEDGWDETLVCADDNRKADPRRGCRHIVDDELDQVFKALRKTTDRIFFISDSCHSGTVSKDLLLPTARIKYLPAAEEGETGVEPAPGRSNEAGIADSEGSATLLSACLDSERAADSYFPGEGWHGVLTHALQQTLREAGPEATCRQILDRVRQIISVDFSQTPQLSGPGQERPFLGGVRRPPPGPPETPTPPLAPVSPQLPHPEVLYVWVQGFGEQTPEVKAALSQSPYWQPTAEESWIDRLLVGSVERGSFVGRVLLRDGTLEGRAQAATAGELVAQLQPVLLKAYLIKQVVGLGNAALELQPEVDLVRVGNPPFPGRSTAYKPRGTTVRVGDQVKFRFRAAKECYLTLVDMSPDGSVTILFPNQYHPAQQLIQPGLWYDVPSAEMGFKIVTEPPLGKEMVVALATERPLEYHRLKLKELGQGMKGIARFEDRVKLFRVQKRSPSGPQRPSVQDGLLPPTGFAVAYLIAEILE